MAKKDAIELLKQGYGGIFIANALNCLVSQVGGLIHNDQQLSAARKVGAKELVRMREDGMSVAQIAKKTGWGKSSISKTFRDEGANLPQVPHQRHCLVNEWIRKPWRVGA